MKGDVSLLKKRIFAVSCFGISLATILTGCSSITPQKGNQTEKASEAVPVVLQSETQTETAIQNETTAKREESLKDIQVAIEKSGRKGTVYLQIEDSTGNKEVNQTFLSSTSAFLSQDAEGNGIYTDKDSMMYGQGDDWKEEDGTYQDVFNLVYSDECEKKEDTVINDNACYHLSLDNDDDIGMLLGYCCMNGYQDIVCGSTHFDFYINLENKKFVRVDVSMPFMATAGDGTDVKGEISGSITVSDVNSEAIMKPEAKAEETEETSPQYKAGELMADKNAYQNQQFGIQILGQSLFSFDPSKTEEIKTNYSDTGSRYQEEAYASGDGVILNVSSVPSNGSSTEDVLKQYLSDSSAENVVSGENLKMAGNTYATASASINQTQTKTYGTGVDGQVLLITVYYTEEGTVDSFEKKNVFSTSDNPFWESETWTLESKYTVTTPSGYSVVKSESGDLYVDMVSSADEINVFAIENSNIDQEREKETQMEGNTTRVVKMEEDIALTDGTSMKYLVVFNTEPNLTYYTYVGLVQKDTAVMKFYAVSTAENAGYKNIYTEIANNVAVTNRETAVAEGTDLSAESTAEGMAETEAAQ